MGVGSNSKTSILTDLSVFINSALPFTPKNAGKTRYSSLELALKADRIAANQPPKTSYSQLLVCQRKYCAHR